MGGCCSSEEEKKSKKIDEDLASTRKNLHNEVKLLLLGPGESGKSTVFKQMKIFQDGGGYSQEELKNFTQIIFENCITQMKAIIHAAEKLEIKLDSEESYTRANRIENADGFSNEIGNDIKYLWKDQGILKAFSMKGSNYHLSDSASYFFDEIDRFMKPDYIPTEMDVLRARVKTVGIEEAKFKFENVAFRVVDVGGQRSERRKWIHCFEQVTAVIFCVALNDYDLTLREDETQNRMRESILLFDQICNSNWFRNTSFILFLNKMDLFKIKIATIDLKVCFPNYTGGCDYDAASGFIRSRFLEQNQSPRDVYTHFTCATDSSFGFVFKAVRDIVLKSYLEGLMSL